MSSFDLLMSNTNFIKGVFDSFTIVGIAICIAFTVTATITVDCVTDAVRGVGVAYAQVLANTPTIIEVGAVVPGADCPAIDCTETCAGILAEQ